MLQFLGRGFGQGAKGESECGFIAEKIRKHSPINYIEGTLFDP